MLKLKSEELSDWIAKYEEARRENAVLKAEYAKLQTVMIP